MEDKFSELTDMEPVLDNETGEQSENILDGFEGFDMDFVYAMTTKDKDISKAQVDKSKLPSNRALESGVGTGYRVELNTLTTKAYLIEYLEDKFNSYDKSREKLSEDLPVEERLEVVESTPIDNALLQYQMEYILIGKESDVDNLKAVIHKLLLLRTPINYAHLLTDTIKQAEAHALAASLSVLSGGVASEPVLYQAILWAWSYAESILEVKALLNGSKIALKKDSTDWRLSIANLFDISKETGQELDQPNGLSYEQYLKTLLYLQGEDEILHRVMDMIEHNIREKLEEDTFRIDQCISSLELDATVEIGGIYNYQFPIKYRYK